MRPGSPSIVSLLLSDSQLARLAAKGDDQAVEAIFRRHRPDLYRFCLAMTGDSQRAQTATQGTLARVRRALPGKDRRTKLKPWLYRIARDEVAAVRPDLERRTEAATEESRAQMRRLLTDLERLPQHQRAVLVMRELSGLDFAQIGSAFETSPAAARETLYEARLRLQQVERSREASCAETMRRLSDSDGRVPWRLGVQLHLRGCPDCRAFREEIANRRSGLAVLTPLPIALGAETLRGALGELAGAGNIVTSGAGISAAVGAGQVAGGSSLVKITATAAAVAVAGFSATDPGGPVEPERHGAGRAAMSRSAPLAVAGAPGPADGRDPGSTATTGSPAATAPADLARSEPARHPHGPAVPTDEGSEQPGVAAHVPSPLPDPAPEAIAREPGATGEEVTSTTVPLADFEPEAEAADVANAAPESPVEEPPDDSAVPLPAPPVPEVEPPSRGWDRSRHHHRDRPWRKHH